jgi:hypothetical protein
VGILGAEIVGSAYCIYSRVPAYDRELLSQVLSLVLIAGLLGGAARALFFLKVEVGGHADHSPQWYLDQWPLYLGKPFLGVAGALVLYLAGRVGFPEAFTESHQAGLVRTLLTALAGGMFFEGAFARLQELIPERRP